MLRDQTIDKLEFHIALGIHQPPGAFLDMSNDPRCLSPLSFVGSSQSHMILGTHNRRGSLVFHIESALKEPYLPLTHLWGWAHPTLYDGAFL